MPTYVYVCEKCGHEFEKVQPMSAEPLEVCTKDLCQQKRWGKGRVKRAISGGAGLIFKGTGFYITDYRSESKEAAKKDSSASSAKPAGGGESKPAAKTESHAKTPPAAKP